MLCNLLSCTLCDFSVSASDSSASNSRSFRRCASSLPSDALARLRASTSSSSNCTRRSSANVHLRAKASRSATVSSNRSERSAGCIPNTTAAKPLPRGGLAAAMSGDCARIACGPALGARRGPPPGASNEERPGSSTASAGKCPDISAHNAAAFASARSSSSVSGSCAGAAGAPTTLPSSVVLFNRLQVGEAPPISGPDFVSRMSSLHCDSARLRDAPPSHGGRAIG
mmetsp:Transcript_76191/g.221209  ORF Transcript_76191/g.221209 Transcript_76191/m.221209 type:complete len:227 (+) Transcript_76191:677-1357(+)